MHTLHLAILHIHRILAVASGVSALFRILESNYTLLRFARQNTCSYSALSLQQMTCFYGYSALLLQQIAYLCTALLPGKSNIRIRPYGVLAFCIEQISQAVIPAHLCPLVACKMVSPQVKSSVRYLIGNNVPGNRIPDRTGLER
jgi:hypothetical protein